MPSACAMWPLVRTPAGRSAFRPRSTAFTVTSRARTRSRLKAFIRLAATFDSCGPLAADFATMLAAYQVMSGGDALDVECAPGRLRLAVPTGAFTNDLDAWARRTFEEAIARIEAAGHELVEVDMRFLHEAVGLNRILVSAEAYDVYKDDLDRLSSIGDARVLARIRFRETQSDEDVANARAARREVIARTNELLSGFDAMLAPTLQMLPPRIAEAEADFDRFNAAMLRNTSLLNLADAWRHVDAGPTGGRCSSRCPHDRRGEGDGRPRAVGWRAARSRSQRGLNLRSPRISRGSACRARDRQWSAPSAGSGSSALLLTDGDRSRPCRGGLLRKTSAPLHPAP